jgi:hypothetical protein
VDTDARARTEAECWTVAPPADLAAARAKARSLYCETLDLVHWAMLSQRAAIYELAESDPTGCQGMFVRCPECSTWHLPGSHPQDCCSAGLLDCVHES